MVTYCHEHGHVLSWTWPRIIVNMAPYSCRIAVILVRYNINTAVWCPLIVEGTWSANLTVCMSWRRTGSWRYLLHLFFYSGAFVVCTHWTWGWVDRRAVLGALEKRLTPLSLSALGNGSRSLVALPTEISRRRYVISYIEWCDSA